MLLSVKVQNMITSCSCSMALWSSPAVIARLCREDEEGGIKLLFGVDDVGELGRPEWRIEERRVGTIEGETCGDSEGMFGCIDDRKRGGGCENNGCRRRWRGE